MADDSEDQSDSDSVTDLGVTPSDVSVPLCGRREFHCWACQGEVTAYCEGCEEYVCRECLKDHKHAKKDDHHKLRYFYCAGSLKVNKYVSANSFCLDCSKYYCERCSVLHTGYRKWKYHVIVKRQEMPLIGAPRKSKKTSRSKFCAKRESARKMEQRQQRPCSHIQNKLHWSRRYCVIKTIKRLTIV